MRSLDDTLALGSKRRLTLQEVAWEVFPTAFLIEEVNQLSELVFINEDEGTALLSNNDFGMVIILRILKMLDWFHG